MGNRSNSIVELTVGIKSIDEPKNHVLFVYMAFFDSLLVIINHSFTC